MSQSDQKRRQKTHSSRSGKAPNSTPPQGGMKSARSNGQLSRSSKSSSTQSLNGRTGSNRSSTEKLSDGGGMKHRSPANSMQGPVNRQTSIDKVKNIVKKEGRAARNLVTWSVPMTVKAGRKASPKTTSAGKSDARKNSKGPTISGRDASGEARTGSNPSTPRRTGADAQTPRRTDMRARYWAFLFDNLHRAVDEIYRTCEADESAVECREVIMMLEQCTNDFKSLIQKMHVLKQFENVEPEARPHSVAWEVRKISPTKQPLRDRRLESPRVVRRLRIDTPPPSSVATPDGSAASCSVADKSPVTTGASYADRVRGINQQLSEGSEQSSVVPPLQGIDQIDDDDGWEMVGRGGKQKSRSPGVSKSNSLPAQHTSSHTQSTAQNRRSSTPSSSRSPTTATKTRPGDKDERSRSSLPKPAWPPSEAGDTSAVKDVHQPAVTGSGAGDAQQTTHADDTLVDKQTEVEDKQTEVEDKQTEVEDKQTEVEDKQTEVEDKQTAEAADDSLLDEDLENAYDSALESVLHAEDDLALKLAEEEASLAREIEQEENYTLDPETETETESELGNTLGSSMASQFASEIEKSKSAAAVEEKQEEEEKEDEEKEDEKDPYEGRLWSDIIEEELEGRAPGWRVKMNEKLSSPSRKRSSAQTEEESRRKMEQKQAKAEQKRNQQLKEKAERLRELTARVEEVRMMKEDIQTQYARTMSERLRRAERKRSIELQKKVRKAQEEDVKVNEIAFISRLEQENRKHDILLKIQENEVRLVEIQEERQRRQETRAAKGAAVETRRKEIDAERRARLERIQEKRRQNETRRERQLAEKERDRQQAARAKEKEREQRLAAIEADKLAKKEELQRKIDHKTTEASRRKQEILQQTREKAFEMSVMKHSTEEPRDLPQLAPYEQQKLCTACNVLIPTEVFLLGHLRGKKHQKVLEEQAGGRKLAKNEIEQFNLKHIVDAPRERSLSKSDESKERIRAMKRRCKKLRQRLQARGAEYESSLSTKPSTSSIRHKIQRLLKDVDRLVSAGGSGPWPQPRVSQLDRALGEMQRLLTNASAVDQMCFVQCSGVTSISKLLMIIDASTDKLPLVVPAKSLIIACNVARLSCIDNSNSCCHALLSNKLMLLLDLLQHQLNLMIPADMDMILSSSSGVIRLPEDPLATALCRLVTAIFRGLTSAVQQRTTPEQLLSRGQDIVSYLVAVGVLDRLAQYFTNVREHINDSPAVADFLDESLQLFAATTLLTSVIRQSSKCSDDCATGDDPTQLLSTLQCTEFVAVLPLLYGALVGQRDQQGCLEEKTRHVVLSGISFLNTIPRISRSLLQSVLGSEGSALQFRHICSYVLNRCQPDSPDQSVLHSLIICIGHFAFNNSDNQLLLQSGHSPTVLQKLGMMPFSYFSSGTDRHVLLPTLLSCCYDSPPNTQLLRSEFSMRLLASYLKEFIDSTTSSQNSSSSEAEELNRRFHRSVWEKAYTYFSEQTGASS